MFPDPTPEELLYFDQNYSRAPMPKMRLRVSLILISMVLVGLGALVWG